MIILPHLSGKYGAPMGRRDEGNIADADTVAMKAEILDWRATREQP